MRALHVLTRGVAPMAVAVGAVGLMSTSAWAATTAPDFRRPPPPPPHVSAGQCHAGHGHVVRDNRNRRDFRCVGGRFNGRQIRF